ncbi:MAG: hypothetical protein GX361_00260 [Bacteroidales bacterium]|nr:hypothetical protein [Bacteroidales bacterium]
MRSVNIEKYYRLRRAMHQLQERMVIYDEKQPYDIDVVRHYTRLVTAYDAYLEALEQFRESVEIYRETYTEAMSSYKKSLIWCREQEALLDEKL